MELIDCVSIADATFMISMFILARYTLWLEQSNSDHQKFKTSLQSKICKKLLNAVSICVALSLFVIFVFILFEFAKSGFLSPTGHAKYLVVLIAIIKILIGVRMICFSISEKYDIVKRVNESSGHDIDESLKGYDI